MLHTSLSKCMKTAIIATLQFLVVCLLSSCAHTYKAPDSTKVIAKTKVVVADQKKAHSLNAEIKTATKSAQEHVDALVVISTEIEGKVDEIIKVATPELQLALAEVKSDLKAQRAHENAIVLVIGLAYNKEGELETHLTLTDSHIAELKEEQVNLFAEGTTLAQQATKESAERAAYQRKAWIFPLSIGAIVVGVVLLIVFWKIIVVFVKSYLP